MKRLMPTHWLFLSLVAMLVLWYTFPGRTAVPKPWNLAGIIPIAFGVWINLAADKSIHAAGTTVKPFEQPSTLITNGAYGMSRNPMYLGFAAILLGVNVLLGTWTPAVIVVMFIVIMDVVFIRAEEQNLERGFGQAWTDYKRNVRRWI